jgi:DNA replication initiation complex subunit (GINS family)
LHDELSNEKNKTSTKTKMLKDEIEKALKKAEHIYEYRERKIALSALSKASGGIPDEELMVKSERALHNDLVTLIKKYREVFRKELMGEKAEDEEVGIMQEGKTDNKIKDKIKYKEKDQKVESEKRAIEAGKSKEGEDEKGKTKSENYAIVRIIEDIPPFAGLEGEYNLKKEDVISLPKNIAKILCDKDKAIKIKD